jgi:hypothetical protein
MCNYNMRAQELLVDSMSHIFISYSHRDTEYAHALADRLQGMGFSVWIDNRLDYGSQWPSEIQKQLDACGAFILIMSPRSYASEWVQSELQRAKRKAKPVFPLLLEGDEPWLSVESTQYYDVRDHRLPGEDFYADLKQAAALTETVQPAPKHPAYNKQSRRPVNRFVGVAGLAAACLCLVVVGIQLPRIMRLVSPFPTRSESFGNITQPPSNAMTAMATLPGAFTTQQTPLESPINTMTPMAPLPVELPDGSTVTLIDDTGDQYQYTITSADLRPLPPNQFLLHLKVRMWTDFPSAGVPFWSDSFRLYVGDEHLKPSNFLDELVARDETKDGVVEFAIDSPVKNASLSITAPADFSGNTKELRLTFP